MLHLKYQKKIKKKFGNYIENARENLKSEGLDKKYIFKESLFSQIKLLGIVWILGCTVIASFTIYVLMIYKGFLLGYIITIIISVFGVKNGIEFLAPTVILKNIIFLPIVFLLATSGIRMYKGIVRKESNIKLEFLRHTIVMLVSIIFAIIISCIDAYFSPIMLQFL
ncbi:MAG: hypothetical protein HFJ45_01390 [Clostridia bacterium]|nr:hypothetical protein [Clostridia bacterium]